MCVAPSHPRTVRGPTRHSTQHAGVGCRNPETERTQVSRDSLEGEKQPSQQRGHPQEVGWHHGTLQKPPGTLPSGAGGTAMGCLPRTQPLPAGGGGFCQRPEPQRAGGGSPTGREAPQSPKASPVDTDQSSARRSDCGACHWSPLCGRAEQQPCSRQPRCRCRLQP